MVHVLEQKQSISIHQTAIIEKGATLKEGIFIGPYCCVGPDVVLDEGVQLISHVVISGRTKIGNDTIIYPFASIGLRPQDLKYKGELSTLEIGKNCHIREHVTINPGTAGGEMMTKIGDHCLLMVGCHVAHDCCLGDHVILVNNATLGGHVVIDDYAVVGGLSAIHQFVRIGAHAMIGGMSGVEYDVIPYGLVLGDRARLCGLNLIGLKRRGFTQPSIQALREAYEMMFLEKSNKLLSERVEETAYKFVEVKEVQNVVSFIRSEKQRPLCLPKDS